jgi:PAS domain S-box-containing protein
MNIANILVVEDEAIVAANIEMRLQSLGYCVPAVVDSCADAITAIDSVHPDLVLMDIRIAGPIDGVATAGIIRSRYEIPVIYLTAYTDDETLQRARQTEPYGYIHKPFEVGELRTAIELALYKHAVERERYARERWFSTTLQSISDGVITTDTEARITFMNPAAEALTGYRFASVISRTTTDIVRLVDEASGLLIDDPVVQAFAGDIAQPHANQLLVSQMGSVTPVDSRTALIRSEHGHLQGAVVVLRDLRERRAIEQRLRLIEIAVQQIDEMVFILEAQPHHSPQIIFMNQSFSSKTGYSFIDSVGHGPDLLHGSGTNPMLVDQLGTALVQGRAFRGEGLAYCKDERSFHAEWSLTPLRDIRGQTTHWVAILRDITRHKRDQEVRWQRQNLESLGVLAGGIAHDFNNLLAVMLGNASMAMLELPLESPVRDLIAPIEIAARRAADLTRQMLSYAGHDRLSAQSLDLNLLVQETCASMAMNMPDGITFRMHLAPELPIVIADVAQIRRMLRNLMLNAHESMSGVPGVIEIHTDLRQIDSEYIASTYLAPNVPPGMYLVLIVQDRGKGMEASVLARVFEPFFSTKFVGRGLGLAEALGIVSAHRGTIKIESSPETGTSCTVLLPANDSD